MATRKHSSKRKAEPLDPNQCLGEHIRELTAIQAHTDALALACGKNGVDALRDNELTAILFDIEERLMHVRDGIQSLTNSNFLTARGEKKSGAGKAVHHG
ncbi:MAG: hypothetical protein A3G20_05050 [Acidobacteria bacterium RIFCSPLOWO2_12_FULL_59_11]|nr:MAG: hypothetical protein A3G20_05050 [Acidobacteria bacterium RIFCSPLOWO2_12_FULL_59_11]